MLRLRIFIYLVFIGAFLENASFAQDYGMMTYNIRYDNPEDGKNAWGQRKESVCNLLKYYEPDILGIQEGLHSQVKYLSSCLNGYAQIGVGRNDGDTAGEYAAIFYKKNVFRLEEHGTFWLSETPDKVSRGWDAALPRICTWAVFKDLRNGKRLKVYNTHFDHRGEKARIESARLIAMRIQKDDKELPLVLMGDLNSRPGSEQIKTITAIMDDGAEISQKEFYGPPGTSNAFKKSVSPKRIDYIFTRNMEVESYAHIDDRRDNGLWVSDHLPVYIRCRPQ